MVSITAALLPGPSVTARPDEPVGCPTCGRAIEEIDVQTQVHATLGERHGNTVNLAVGIARITLTGRPCGHVLYQSDERDDDRARRQAYAREHGYFWLPCPLCGEQFGGHEWGGPPGYEHTIPDPDDPMLGHGICPACTMAGRGNEAWGIPVPPPEGEGDD